MPGPRLRSANFQIAPPTTTDLADKTVDRCAVDDMEMKASLLLSDPGFRFCQLANRIAEYRDCLDRVDRIYLIVCISNRQNFNDTNEMKAILE